jgi:hypothetical protein
VDAVLLVGALVHIPHSQLVATLKRILAALKDRGIALLTVKEGAGERSDATGRTFYLWRHEEMQRLLLDDGFKIRYFNKQRSAMGTGEAWPTYVLARHCIAGACIMP